MNDNINSNTNNYVEPVDMLNAIEMLNNISQENDDQEICVICQDILDNGEQVHFLPECNHGYHTNCILTWFRTGNNNCPCCGNRGVNFKEPKQTTAPRSRWGWRTSVKRIKRNPRYVTLRRFSQQKDAPKQLKELVSKLKDYEDNLDELQKKFKATSNEREEMKCKEAEQAVKSFYNKRMRLENKIYEYVAKITDYPIIPLIIPKKKSIN